MRHLVEVTETTSYVIDVPADIGASTLEIEGQARALWNSLTNSDRIGFEKSLLSCDFQYQGRVAPEWTNDQELKARRSRWSVREAESGLYQITNFWGSAACPEAPSFRSQEAASYYVRYMAAQGDELCAAAVAFVDYKNQGES